MANSTYLETVNTILTMAGQVTVGNSSGDFNSNTLDKPQQQAKQFVDYANRFLALETKGRFTKRKYTLTTDPTTNVYAISWQTSFERLIKDSWCITAPQAQAQPIFWKNYNTWINQFPYGEINSGIPNFWIPLPDTARIENPDTSLTSTITNVTPGTETVITLDVNDRVIGDVILVYGITGTIGTDVLNDQFYRITAVSGLDVTIQVDTTTKLYTSGGMVTANRADRISFSPPPSLALTVQYEGYLNTVALQYESDPIIWPVEYEHLLWTAGVALLEGALGEGKAPSYQAMVEPAVTQVKQLSIGPVEEIPAIDLGITINNRQRDSIYVWNNQ